MLNHKFIPNSPQRPGQDPNGQPPSVAQRGWDRLEFGKESGEIVMVPVSTHNLAETAPKELRGHAGEEDMVQIFFRPTERVAPIPRAIAFQNLNARWEAAANPLPQEDPNFQGGADLPNGGERLMAKRWGDGLV